MESTNENDLEIDNELLMVKSETEPELQVVSGQNKDGILKTLPGIKENGNDFMKFDKNGNALENFVANFGRQYKNPKKFQFFRVPEKIYNVVAGTINAVLSGDAAYQRTHADTLNEYKIDPNNPLLKLDMKEFEKLGLTKEVLQNSGALEALGKWEKSPTLLPITLKTESGESHKFDARISVRINADNTLSIKTHPVKRELDLDRPYFNVQFSDEDKLNLKNSGNLGRTIDVKYRNDEDSVKVFVSVDPLTNEITATRSDKIFIPKELLGVTLSEEQRQGLADGKGVLVENMTGKSGKEFSATIQVNADLKRLDFKFDNTPKKQEQTNVQSENKEVKIPEKIGGQALSAENRKTLEEGKTIYVEGLIDRKGESYNAYITVNKERGKLDFSSKNPVDKALAAKPDEASKTQVAVNSEGKTNEATKAVKEPLKQGQVSPTAEQKKEKTETKSKGRKM